jgi:hypothetical protein
MKIKAVLPALAVLLLFSAAPSGASTPSSTPQPDTPNSCIERNHGDWNACNVGNSGRGDLPYKPVTNTPNTPNECIKRNHGDWNACNVGNSGRGDLPYLPPSG